MDYIIHYDEYLQMKHAWKSVVINQCKLYRTQKQSILELTAQNNRFASCMLTGSRSTFLDTHVA